MWGRRRDRGESQFGMEPCEREKRLAECAPSGTLPSNVLARHIVSRWDVHVLLKPISQPHQSLPPHSPSHRTTLLRFYHSRDRGRWPGRSSVSNWTKSAFHRFPATNHLKNNLSSGPVLGRVLVKADLKERPSVLSVVGTANWRQSLPAVS